MAPDWFARPVLLVTDIQRTLDFYVQRLGFTESWRYEEDGLPRVAQAERQGCALIFSTQWADRVGKGLIFVSLQAPNERRVTEALDALHAEFVGRGVAVEEGQWGYRLLVVRDPDGNELYFNYPNSP